MPHIPRTQSIVNGADNSPMNGGMKKAGLIRDGYPRVAHRILLSKAPSTVMAFRLTNISSFGRTSYRGRNRIV